jgi:hypothetical protein
VALERRLEGLEARLRPDLRGYPPWDMDSRIDAATAKLEVHRMGSPPEHTSGYFYTDLEIDALGAAVAQQALEGGPGAYLFDSGAVVHFVEERGANGLARPVVEGRVEVEDLPEHIRPYVVRMPSGEQQLGHEWLWYRWHQGVED